MIEVIVREFDGIPFHVKNGTVVVDSRDIARSFNRQHRNVMQSINRLDCSEKFSMLNFQRCEFRNKMGRNCPHFLITRDGFVFLAMGFSGHRAARFKETYITAFNAMEQWIRSQGGNPASPDRISTSRLTEVSARELHEISPSLRHRMFTRTWTPEEASIELSRDNSSATPEAIMQMIELQQWVIRDKEDGSLRIVDEALQGGFLTYRQPKDSHLKIRILETGIEALRFCFSDI